MTEYEASNIPVLIEYMIKTSIIESVLIWLSVSHKRNTVNNMPLESSPTFMERKHEYSGKSSVNDNSEQERSWYRPLDFAIDEYHGVIQKKANGAPFSSHILRMSGYWACASRQYWRALKYLPIRTLQRSRLALSSVQSIIAKSWWCSSPMSRPDGW